MSWLYFNDRNNAIKISGFILLLAILSIMFDYIISYQHEKNKIIKQNELTQVTGTLANQPKIEVAEQGSPWVTIKLKEFPDFKFIVDDVHFSALKAKDFVSSVKIGDTILLDILSYDYNSKIKKEKALRISERIINYAFIEPYGLKANGKTYMTLEDVNAAWQDDQSLGFWLLIPAVILLILYAILDLTGMIDKFKNWFDRLQASR